MNRLYYGDCLTIMQDFGLASVDLIYLDPPFNSNRQYNAIYKDETGRPLPDQIEAFCDMWELDSERESAIRAMPVLMRESGHRRCHSGVLATLDERAQGDATASAGLSQLHGPTALDHVSDFEANRKCLSPLRPHSLSLHQGPDGRDIRAH